MYRSNNSVPSPAPAAYGFVSAANARPMIDPTLFSYAVVTDQGDSKLIRNGEVYPILHTNPADHSYSQAAGGRSVALSFNHSTLVLAGVKKAGRRTAYGVSPRTVAAAQYAWDARRFRTVSWSGLTSAQQREAIARFGTSRG